MSDEAGNEATQGAAPGVAIVVDLLQHLEHQLLLQVVPFVIELARRRIAVVPSQRR